MKESQRLNEGDFSRLNGSVLKYQVRRLTDSELNELRKDMAESSAWAKVELKRRRTAKNQKISAHGTGDGIDNEHISN
ncbi:hypothetical protein ACWONT_003656 [Vibrio parahaemolyticus]